MTQNILTQIKCAAMTLNPSLYMRFVFTMLMGFAAANIGATALAQTITPLPNPFAAYADVFPGQPESTAQAKATSCQTVYTYRDTPAQESCTFNPTEGIFSSVEVIFSRGVIRQITFIVRENTLKVGDLEIFWQKSPVEIAPQIAYFRLAGKLAVVEMSERRFSRFLGVRSVSFTNVSDFNAD